MKKNPKYSIIIPTYNGIQYLPTCIKTITDQDYEDYELVISDDHSTDGTQDFLKALDHPNITVIYPVETLSMTEHWEWALSHCSGEWSIFVGQDDGLQPYFFELADRLTIEAKEKKVRTIASSRAYFFWQGCEYVYGDIAVSYLAENKTKLHNFKYQALKCLLGVQEYFELPQMYTTSLFHKDILNEARLKQNGRVLSCHPQDANLAAIACSLEKEYLKSYLPLGWVGSSPKSAGMAITSERNTPDNDNKEVISTLKKEYEMKVMNSKLKYHPLAGDFSFGSLEIYFWQALLSIASLQTKRYNSFLNSKLLKYFMFCSVLNEVNRSNKTNDRLNEFKSILNKNKCNYFLIRVGSSIIKISAMLSLVPFLIYRVVRKVYRKINRKRLSYNVFWKTGSNMIQASSDIQRLLVENKWIQNEK